MGLINKIDDIALKEYKNMELTESQNICYNQAMCLLQEFNVLIIDG